MESKLNNLEILTSETEISPGSLLDSKGTMKIETTMSTAEGKLILTTESIENAKKNAENQRALEKLDKLLQTNSITKKKIVKAENGEKSSNVTSIVTVKSIPVKKEAPRILNASLAKSPNPDNKRLLNNIGKSVMSEKDLIAILEGNNQDEEGDVDVKVIEDSAGGKKKTMTTVLLSKNQELRIAADQMKEISRKSGIKQNNTIPAVPGAPSETTYEMNELVSSIASEWSDTERENPDTVTEVNEVKQTKQIVKKKKVEPKLPTTQLKEEENESEETIDIKEEKPIQPTGIAPFKRSRVIKKKIIWDPDAPETQFSYASLIKPKPKPNANKKTQKEAANEVSAKLESDVEPKKPVVEKPKQTANRKRKEPSPDKTQQKIEDVLNEILSEEINPVPIENIENSAPPPVKVKEPVQGPKKPRMTKSKQNVAQSSSWDYINKGQSDEMMIIRRRSSSYSSTTSQRRQSLEQQQTPPQKAIKVIRKISDADSLKANPAKKRKQEIQLKKVIAANQDNTVKLLPVVKKLSIVETKKLVPPSPTPQLPVNKKVSRNTPTADLEKVSVSVTNSTSTNIKVIKVTEKKEEKLKFDFEIITKKLDSVVNLILDIKTENPANTFSIDFIKKFVSILENLYKDNSCKVVVVTSKGTHFCHGIDFSCLLASTIEKRKTQAIELARNVKLLFETLINFNKPLIAAVSGILSNLGVTILPLFDVVFASDKCAFEMSYSKIGQIPEGNCILSTINMDKKYKMKLIYLAEKLTANEALSAGLITAIYPTQRLEAEAINVAMKMGSLSQQTYKSLKELNMRKLFTDEILKTLEEEQKILIEHWISAECQEKFKSLLQK